MATDPPSDPAQPRRRTAPEHLTDRPPGRHWPVGALAPGARVTAVRSTEWDGPWQVEFQGAVDDLGAPEPVDHPHGREGAAAYWVRFDAPQYDADGDGPYRTAPIWERYLRPED
ncbi:ferrous iron transport protein A [Kitasatospora griseola]|uniref:ferrous iron transport protein A n=1 Tax=Kitasatospora griseola TaxID=2064 RepID=UPI0038275917